MAFVGQVNVLLLLVSLLGNQVLSEKKVVYWNASNPIFRVDNTDHVIDVEMHDQLDIYCPDHRNLPNSEAARIVEEFIRFIW